MKNKFITLLLILTLITISLLYINTTQAASHTQPMIIDTDMGTDDVIAILYLLQKKDVDIKAMTIAANGNAHCKPAYNNLYAILKKMKHATIPIACGRSTPLKGTHIFPDYVLNESDTLGGIASSFPKNKTPDINAIALLAKTLSKSKQPIDILAIGPLTNLAELVTQFPNLKNKIKMIYMMGGAINVPGNLTIVDPNIKSNTAEWNIYIDPEAAAILFKSGVPITIVPLDITNETPVTQAFYDKLKLSHANTAANMTYAIFKGMEPYIKKQEWYFWDSLAAVIATDQRFTTFKNEKITVKVKPESLSGATVIDNKNGTPTRVATEIETKKFEDVLLHSLTIH